MGGVPAHVLRRDARLYHAATEAPPGPPGFAQVPAAGFELWFRAPGGIQPDVLEIGLRASAGRGSRRTGTAACSRSAPDPVTFVIRDAVPADLAALPGCVPARVAVQRG